MAYFDHDPHFVEAFLDDLLQNESLVLFAGGVELSVFDSPFVTIKYITR